VFNFRTQNILKGFWGFLSMQFEEFFFLIFNVSLININFVVHREIHTVGANVYLANLLRHI
jgi:hypothetical protein